MMNGILTCYKSDVCTMALTIPLTEQTMCYYSYHQDTTKRYSNSDRIQETCFPYLPAPYCTHEQQEQCGSHQDAKYDYLYSISHLLNITKSTIIKFLIKNEMVPSPNKISSL